MFWIYQQNNQVDFWVYNGELGLISTDDNENDLEDEACMLDICQLCGGRTDIKYTCNFFP